MAANERRTVRRPVRRDASVGTASVGAATAGDRRACATESRAPRRRVAKKRRIWLRVTLSLVVAFVLAVAAAFSWQRWLRFDDAQDFQGAWYAVDALSEAGALAAGDAAQGADALRAVSISADSIQLTDDVAYSYYLDSWSKTLSFSFGKYVGSGSYQFSLDRRILVIKDGSYSWFSTLGDDAAWMFQNLLAAIQGGQPPLPSGDNVIVLVRE